MTANQLLEQFRHDSKWLELRLRLTYEYQSEGIRQAIAGSKLRRTRFKVHGKLRELLRLR